MEILAHRGYWQQTDQQNTLESFSRALDAGFGIETDVRLHNGELIVSHDHFFSGAKVSFKEFLDLLTSFDLNEDQKFAINIKEDGLALPLSRIISLYEIQNYFCFDMSVPDCRPYLSLGLQVFSRQSEEERCVAFGQAIAGVWIDSFEGTWFDSSTLETLLQKYHQLAIVSPELHGRDHRELWEMLDSLKSARGLMLCTDFPDEARHHFS